MPSFKAERFSLHLTKYVKRYSTELNPLSHDIYLRVIWIIYVLFGLSLTKAFQDFLTDKVYLKNSFAKMLVIEIMTLNHVEKDVFCS